MRWKVRRLINNPRGNWHKIRTEPMKSVQGLHRSALLVFFRLFFAPSLFIAKLFFRTVKVRAQMSQSINHKSVLFVTERSFVDSWMIFRIRLKFELHQYGFVHLILMKIHRNSSSRITHVDFITRIGCETLKRNYELSIVEKSQAQCKHWISKHMWAKVSFNWMALPRCIWSAI